MLGFEILKEIHQRFNAVFGHGVVDRNSQAANRFAMSQESNHYHQIREKVNWLSQRTL